MLGIFDVYANPNAAHALVLANLCSEKLWELGAKVDSALDLGERLRQYQRVIDKYFTHLSPEQVALHEGWLEISAEEDRLGRELVRSALSNIVATFELRKGLGALSNIDPILDNISDGRFPSYHYLALDALEKQLRETGRKHGRVLGMTSCLDEAALFAALIMTGRVDDIDGIVLMGSASHYTVLCWSGEPGTPKYRCWWFYGKNALYSREEYQEIVNVQHSGDAHRAFFERMTGMDTIIGREGSLRVGSPFTSLDRERMIAIVSAAGEFFGCTPPELLRALENIAHFEKQTAAESLFVSCLAQTSATDVRNIVIAASRQQGGLGELAFEVERLAGMSRGN